MSVRSQRAGRKDSTERMRELVALLGSLSHTGDAVTIDAISSRMGISHEDASTMMDIVCQASGEESSGLLISANDDMTEFTLQYPDVHGRPIRLTASETVAVTHALDLVGIAPDDEIRVRLKTAFTSPEIEERDVRHALGDRISAPSNSLFLCARAQAEQFSLSFLYLGLRDKQPRPRCVAVDKILSRDGAWYMEAQDLDICQQRTFRIDRMSNVRLDSPLENTVAPKGRDQGGRIVRIIFNNELYLNVFEWPGLVIQSRKNGQIRGEIPYYGEGNDWLIRRLAACGGDVVVEDDRISQLVREYIARQLS